jgi:hypothetical protein
VLVISVIHTWKLCTIIICSLINLCGMCFAISFTNFVSMRSSDLHWRGLTWARVSDSSGFFWLNTDFNVIAQTHANVLAQSPCIQRNSTNPCERASTKPMHGFVHISPIQNQCMGLYTYPQSCVPHKRWLSYPHYKDIDLTWLRQPECIYLLYIFHI